MKCKICKNESKKIFTQKVLSKYDVDYYKCDNCGFIQTQKPFWLKEAYKEPISPEDSGIIERNTYFSNLSETLIKHYFNKKRKFLDYAGGYGIFTRLMRNKGFDFYWCDLYAKNLFSKGFEYNNKDKIEAITCFECFEHFNEPIKEIEKMLKISENIIFSTRLIPKEIPEKNWDYFGTTHGQHIAFYSKKTLNYIAKKYKLNFYSKNNIHIITKRKINTIQLNVIFIFIKIKIFIKKVLI